MQHDLQAALDVPLRHRAIKVATPTARSRCARDQCLC